MRIVAVVPAFNEARHIGDVVRDALKHVEMVIAVDDGSTDATAERARHAGAFVVSHAMNSGPGAATTTGIHAARLVHNRQFGMMVSLKGTEIVAVPLEKAVGALKIVPEHRIEELGILQGEES